MMRDRRGFLVGAAGGVGALTAAGCATREAAAQQPGTGFSGASFNVVYPSHDGARFDMAYYRASHIPLVQRVMNPTNTILIEGAPLGAAPPPYVMIAHFQFASDEALDAALANPAMADLRADLPAFTDIRPSVMRGRTP